MLEIGNKNISPNKRGRSIAISNDGEFIVIGFKDGCIRIYDRELNIKKY